MKVFLCTLLTLIAVPVWAQTMGASGPDTVSRTGVYTYDMGLGIPTSMGIAGARFTSANQSGGFASVTSAPATGKKLVITDLIISVDTAMRVDFAVESATGTVIRSVYMAANSTVNLRTTAKMKLATADKKLQVQTSASGNISVETWYYSEK